MTIKIIVPDVDGMLVLGPKFSTTIKKEKNINVTKIFTSGDYKACQKGEKDLKKVLKKHGFEPEKTMEYWFSLYKRNEEVINHLKRIKKEKGIKIVIATNQEKYRLKFLLELLNSDEWVDQVIASCDVHLLKPDINFYKKIKAKPEEVLIFDDKDYTHLKKAGYSTEKYTTIEKFEKKLAKHF